MTNEEMRKANFAHIRKTLRSRNAKERNWPGAPVSHFEVTGVMGEVFKAQIADGSLKLVERAKPSGASACFVVIA